MASRKKKRNNKSSIFGSPNGSRELEELVRGFLAGSRTSGIDDSFGSKPLPENPTLTQRDGDGTSSKPENPPVDPETQIRRIGQAARFCWDHITVSRDVRPKGKGFTVVLLNYKDHALLGTVTDEQGKTHQLEFQMDFARRSCGTLCTCNQTKRVSMCAHAGALTREIIDQADQKGGDSTLHRLVLGDEIVEQQIEKRRKAATVQVLGLLRHLPILNPRSGNPQSLDEVPVVEQEQVQWNLNFSVSRHGNRFGLNPLRQKEKKSGGWSKGRETTLKSFMEMSRDCWSELDWKIAGRVRPQTRHPYYELSMSAAFDLLAGSPAFHLNGSPSTLEVRNFELVVKDVEGGWCLSTSVQETVAEWGGSDVAHLCVHEEGRLIVDPDENRAAWITMPSGAAGLERQLADSNPVFQQSDRDLLIDRLHSIRGVVPVMMPPSLGGERIPEHTESVLLLQMRRNGILEATVCIRSLEKLLIVPGTGMIVRHDTIDGKPAQYVRDGQDEIQRCQKIVRQLGLHSFRNLRDWVWQISDPDDVIEVLTNAGELATAEELTIVWHQASARQLNIIGRLSKSNVSVQVAKQRDWFGLNGNCRIGKHDVPLKDILAGLRGSTGMPGFVEVSPGQWAGLTQELRKTLQQLADVSHDSRGSLQLDAAAALTLSDMEDQQLNVEADKAWQKCLTKVRSSQAINPEPPAGLQCDLRDYQVDGFRWMSRLAEWGVGGILADDMGLGKTVQTLATLLHRVESGPALVVAPTSLGFNWEQECLRFTPSLTPRLLRDADRAELIRDASEGDIVICSYGLALREAKLLQSVKWGTIVLDEAQNVKNSNSKTAKEIRSLKADWKVALTGTPMENHLGELWSVFRAVSPGVLGPWEQFRRKFAAPIEKDNDAERGKALSGVISPFVMRRSKSEVLKDLPERSETNLLIELSPEERERYDQVRLAAVGELDSLGDGELSTDHRFKVLQLLTRLRQLACHVKMVDDKWEGGSSKLTMLMERLEQLKERGHRPLIFSQFTTHLGLIREACDQAGISYQYLDGQTTPKGRQQRVEAFQSGKGDAFLISLKAGGTGLNLTAADYVIHMDPWWNPAVEDQATDRAHRIGQEKHVMVYRIVAKDTIEEQILSLHAEKRDLVEGVLSGSDAAAKLSTAELALLIKQGIHTAKV